MSLDHPTRADRVIAGGGLLALLTALWVSHRARGRADRAKRDAETKNLERSAPRAPALRDAVPPPSMEGLWPLPMWGDYSPVVSDGWGSRRRTLDGTPRPHRGVDLMYPRKSLDDQAAAYPPNTAGGATWHFVPDGIDVLAARAGTVTYAAPTPRGHAVTIDHRDGWSTFYQHLASLRVARGDVVTAGQPLGRVGGDPTQARALRHLHFEVRRHGTPIDPAPLLRTWHRLRPLAVADGASATVLLPPPRFV